MYTCMHVYVYVCVCVYVGRLYIGVGICTSCNVCMYLFMYSWHIPWRFHIENSNIINTILHSAIFSVNLSNAPFSNTLKQVSHIT